MLLNIDFREPLSLYYDLSFAIPFEEDGVESESRSGSTRTFTFTYSNGLQEQISVEELRGNTVRIGDLEILAPDGRVLINAGFGDLGIETNDLFNTDPDVNIESYRFDFSDADDTVMLDTNLVISETRGTEFESRNIVPFEPNDGAALDFRFGGGEDRVMFDAARDDIGVVENNDIYRIERDSGGTGRFRELEAFDFTDGTLVLDETGAFADYTYALYTAALTRTPDEAGFRFWNGVMNSGDFSGNGRVEAELRLAREFVEAPEFTSRFDVSTNESFIDALYQNVLLRTPDRAGFDFWLDVFDSGEQGRDDMLRFFAASEENTARIADDIDTGYWVV